MAENEQLDRDREEMQSAAPGSTPRTETSSSVREVRVTPGQLEAIAMRCREELAHSLRRGGTDAVASIKDNMLTVHVAHSITSAEHNLMRREAGRALFQHYLEELAEQMYPDFARHVESILPYAVSFTRIKVDCDADCIILTFGLRDRPSRLHRDP